MDWKPWKSDLKLQFINAGLGTAFDTSFCVTFSALNCLQTIFNWMISSGLISLSNLIWLEAKGYLKDGKVDFSPRYTGTMADTTIYGNTNWNVFNCIIAYGLIPETMHPNRATSWSEYASESKITQEMKDLGAEFRKRFDITDKDGTLKDLETSPLWAGVKFTDGAGVLAPNGKVNHFIQVVDDGDGISYNTIKDSYWQELKKYAREKIFFIKALYIKEKPMLNDTQFLINNEKKILFEVGKGRFGIVINGKLREITPERAAHACLYALVNNKLGVTVQQDLFESLPKGEDF